MKKPLFKLDDASLAVRRDSVSLFKRASMMARRDIKDLKKQTLLKEISLTINPGEKIGLIGDNGAGKSTLLRVLAGIYPVTQGRIQINCKPYGLFSVGQGTNPRASGLDNIYLRCFQLGMTRSEIKNIVPDIVRFSELGPAIHNPIKQYSAGMQLRLNTAISLANHADFFLLDEWIGAGDAKFREKIEKRIQKLLQQSQGLVVASHNHSLLGRLCDRIIWMDQGHIKLDGKTEDVIPNYEETKKQNKSTQ